MTTILHRYEILHKIGEGGMGEVFLVEDRFFPGRSLALKRVKSPELAGLFRAELVLLRSLAHPHLPEVYDLHEDPEGGRPAFTMELCDGPQLGEWVDTGEVGEEQAVEVLVQLARTLLHIHEQGRVHGDLNPANVILVATGEAPRVKVLDFGLSSPTAGGGVSGALPWLAPETLAGAPVSPRSDLFSLGVLGWQLFFGKHPYPRYPRTLPDAPPPQPAAVGAKGKVAPLLRRLLSPTAAERPASAAEVLDQLSDLLGRPVPHLTVEIVSARVSRVDRVDVGGEGEALRRAAAALEAPPQLVRVAGAPGSGRSRLLRVLADSLLGEGKRVIATTCAPGEATLAPVRRLLLGALGAGGDAPEVEALSEGQRAALAGVLPEWAPSEASALVAEDPVRARANRVDALARLLLSLGRRAPTTLLVDGLELGDGETREVMAAIGRAMEGGVDPEARLLVVVADALDAGADIVLSPFAVDHVRQWLERLFPGRRVSHGLAVVLHALSGGNPLLLVEATRGLFEAGHLTVGATQAAAAPEMPARPALPRTVDDMLRGKVERLDAKTRSALVAISLLEVPATPPLLGALLGEDLGGVRVALDRLESLGLLSRDVRGDRIACTVASPVVREAALGFVDADERWRLHVVAAGLLEQESGDEPRVARAIHLLRAAGAPDGPVGLDQAVAVAVDTAEGLAARSAFALVDRLIGSIDDTRVQGAALRRRLLVLQGDAAVQLAAFDRAEAAYVRLLAEVGADPDLRADALRRAGVLELRRGAFALATDRLGDAVATLAGRRPLDSAEARSWLAQALLYGGDYARAIEEGEEARRELGEGDQQPVVRARLSHVLGLAAFYQGRLEDAEGTLGEALARYEALGRPGDVAALRTCLGIVQHRKDRYDEALAEYQGALEMAERAGDRARQWSLLMNMGVVYQERGDVQRAIEHYERSLRLSEVLGDRGGVLKNCNNLGNVYRYLGQLDRARALVERSLALCRSEKNRFIEGYNLSLLGEIERLEGACGDPEAHLRAALALFEELGSANEITEVQLELGQLALDRGAHDDVAAWAGRALEAALRHGARDLRVRALTLRAEAERVRADGAPDRAGELVEDALRSAEGLDSPEVLWPLRFVAARVLRDLGETRKAIEHGLAALEILRGLVRPLPPKLAESFMGVRDRREAMAELRWIEALEGHAARAQRTDVFGADMAKLLEINKRLNTEHDVTRLLEFIMDSAIVLTGAERGFLLLGSEEDGPDGLTVRVARNIDRENIKNRRFKISTSIAERVMEEGEPIITVDAMEDERYREYLSIHNLRLRSILCLPLRLMGRSIGVLYIDNRFQASAFGEVDLAFMEAFADQAAIAIGNARLFEENLRQKNALAESQRRVEDLNKQLEEKLQRTSLELAETQTRMARQQQQLESRHRYEALVGQSAKLREVFYIIDRLLENDIPVLIGGESGTGKELVARAIHYNGARRSHEFVAVNCGSIPASLFESELFGHVRGAFTGASADKRGFFEVAHKGTLFLDEIGEMPLEMQVKLLRVLQSGEVQKVGSPRTTKVDVRIVAATNRDLKEQVRRKEFREDLFYRINVVPIQLPALRERKDDIPLLVQHFIKENRASGLTRIKGISADALTLLARYDFPGNVRELETIIKNASVFAEGEQLTPASFAHFHEIVAAASGVSARPVGRDGDGLPFSPGMTIAELEREAIIRTLEACGGNKKKTAELLGIDRRTLYNKLDGYQIRLERQASVVRE